MVLAQNKTEITLTRLTHKACKFALHSIEVRNDNVLREPLIVEIAVSGSRHVDEHELARLVEGPQPDPVLRVDPALPQRLDLSGLARPVQKDGP